MGVCRRAALYLARKKGKSLLLFLVFFAVSALLLLCVSVLEGTGQAARELRSSVGASFTIRPYAQMTLEEGEITQAAAPVVSQESIDQILAAAQGQVKAYNTEQYGYAKSQQLHFLPGAGDNTASNMGQVTAVRDSQLVDVFREEEYTLLAGRHIQPEDQGAILISAELAAENGLAVGDSVTLTHAGLGQQDGEYLDTIPEKTAFAQVEIVGIFQCGGAADSGDTPTAGKAVNHIYGDSGLLVRLQEQQPGLFEGELTFYIADPLELDALLERVEALSSIDWDNHILRGNDFQYQQIAGPLQNLQSLAAALTALTCGIGFGILALLLLLRLRGRVHEAGVYLSLGRPKGEILGQFALEAVALLVLGFLLALLLWALCCGWVNRLLFGSLAQEAGAAALANYLRPNTLRAGALLAGEGAAVLLAVLAASGAILRLKPKEILSKLG